jgi:transcriptional regulator with XRE-family HTH domain
VTGNRELGEFLRSRRVRLRPDDVGIVPQRRRRAAGLRREEVASLAGISAEWYVKLEQGRAISPSEETVEALGQALRLNAVERQHLRSLAGNARRGPFVREPVPDILRRVVGGLSQPAYVTGQRWDVLAWNAAAEDLLTDFGSLPIEDRNILVFMFTDPAARRLFGGSWEEEARRMVALFRATHDLWAGDSAFEELVSRLSTGCSEFADWWTSHDVAAPISGAKLLTHPRRGPLRFEYATFQANDNPLLKLALYVDASSD